MTIAAKHLHRTVTTGLLEAMAARYRVNLCVPVSSIEAPGA